MDGFILETDSVDYEELVGLSKDNLYMDSDVKRFDCESDDLSDFSEVIVVNNFNKLSDDEKTDFARKVKSYTESGSLDGVILYGKGLCRAEDDLVGRVKSI